MRGLPWTLVEAELFEGWIEAYTKRQATREAEWDARGNALCAKRLELLQTRETGADVTAELVADRRGNGRTRSDDVVQRATRRVARSRMTARRKLSRTTAVFGKRNRA
jgi:hypothetical protein